MLKISYLAIFIFLFSSFTGDNPKMVRKTVARNITALMPEDFRPMTDQELASKYFTYRKPVAMFTNQDGTVDFGFNVSATTWKYEDLELLQKFYKSSIQNLYTNNANSTPNANNKDAHTSSEKKTTENLSMIQEGIREINKQKYIVFEFVAETKTDPSSPIQRSKKVYTYMQYTIVGEEVHIFNFTAPAHLRTYWSPIAAQMMKSLKL
jgi:uncharacterized protein YdaT